MEREKETKTKMKVQLVASEFFAWGIYGGFGAFTRKLAKELVSRGVQVEVIVQKISDEQKPHGETEVIDGIPVKTLPRRKISKLRNKSLYKTDADIIHSQCGMYDTYLTFMLNQNQKKIVTIQDLRTKQETEKLTQPSRLKKLWIYYVKSMYRKAMKQSDVVACQAKLLFPKVQKIFNIKPNILLPNFVDIPKNNYKKTDDPSVVWLGRLDMIKCPELCFELARKTPYIQYYILGKAHDQNRDALLRQTYRKIPNLHLLGFQSRKTKEETLSKAWILINTSIYECLPVSFLEAMSYKCALLSTQNPDDYTNMFGVHAKPTVESLTSSLSLLLMNDTWRGLGEKAYQHISNVHSTPKGVEAHIKLYKELID